MSKTYIILTILTIIFMSVFVLVITRDNSSKKSETAAQLTNKTNSKITTRPTGVVGGASTSREEPTESTTSTSAKKYYQPLDNQDSNFDAAVDNGQGSSGVSSQPNPSRSITSSPAPTPTTTTTPTYAPNSDYLPIPTYQ